MRKIKKIGICAAVSVGVGAAVFSVEKLRKKWFTKGYNTGKVIGSMDTAEQLTEQFADETLSIVKQYNKLCEDYKELANLYDDMLDYYNED